MAKRKVFRVRGVVKTADTYAVLRAIALVKGVHRMTLASQKKDKNEAFDQVDFKYVQADFSDLENAKECRENLRPFLVKDRSDFLHLI